MRTWAVTLMALLLPATLLTMASPANARSVAFPSVRLVSGSDIAVIHLYRSGHYQIDWSAFLASEGGAFELWAQRPTYFDPVGLTQVIRDANGDVSDTAPVPSAPEPNLSRGLSAFFTTELTRKNGTPLDDGTRAFCPSGWSQQRLDDLGPTTSPYPEYCYAAPFTRGVVWGIEQGWATRANATLGRHLGVDPGTYRLTLSIAEPYRTAFGVAAEDAELTVPVVVVKGNAQPAAARTQTSSAATTGAPDQSQNRLTGGPITIPPDSALPDIEALPAWGIHIDNKKGSGRAYMNFGATAWNAGPGPLVVEGFRDSSTPTMDAFQYFYEDGAVVGKVAAGQLEYDTRDGHQHWHFRDFAAYSLLDADKTKVLDSGKEAFCLAPTDPIDLTVDGAEWRPWLTDLGTACGEQGSLWIREVLETGWGDTYAQYRPGQSFEITDLPNGTYFIRVLANPDDVLLESSAANNEALRKVKIHGKPGERWVEVPAYGLIDTESGNCGYFC